MGDCLQVVFAEDPAAPHLVGDELGGCAFDIETTELLRTSARVTTFAVYGDGAAALHEHDDEAKLTEMSRDVMASLPAGRVVT